MSLNRCDTEYRIEKLLKKYALSYTFTIACRESALSQRELVEILVEKTNDAYAVAKMLTQGLFSDLLYESVDLLVGHGVSADEIVKMLNPYMLYTEKQAGVLVRAGANPDTVIDIITEVTLHRGIEFYVNAGASPEKLLEKITYIDADNGKFIIECLKRARVDMNKLVDKIEEMSLLEWLKELVAAGADIEIIRRRIRKLKGKHFPVAVVGKDYRRTINELCKRAI